MSPPRPFNPDALKPYAVPWLLPNVGNWSAVWRYTVLVLVQQILPDGTVKPVASEQDVVALELMFIEHFGGHHQATAEPSALPPATHGGRAKLGKRTGTKCSRCMRRRPLLPTSISRPSALNCQRRWSKDKCLSAEKTYCCFDTCTAWKKASSCVLGAEKVDSWVSPEETQNVSNVRMSPPTRAYLARDSSFASGSPARSGAAAAKGTALAPAGRGGHGLLTPFDIRGRLGWRCPSGPPAGRTRTKRILFGKRRKGACIPEKNPEWPGYPWPGYPPVIRLSPTLSLFRFGMAIPCCRVIIREKGLRMSQITVQVQVSDAFRELGYSDEELRQEVPVLLVLKRFRQGLISSGKAARILGWSRRDFLDLLSREGIPLYDPAEEELAEEWKTAQRLGSGQ